MPNKKRTSFDVLLYGGREETRTPMPKALDPKSSASTNFATRPYYSLSAISSILYLIVNLSLADASTAPLEKRYLIFFLRQSATRLYSIFNLFAEHQHP